MVPIRADFCIILAKAQKLKPSLASHFRSGCPCSRFGLGANRQCTACLQAPQALRLRKDGLDLDGSRSGRAEPTKYSLENGKARVSWGGFAIGRFWALAPKTGRLDKFGWIFQQKWSSPRLCAGNVPAEFEPAEAGLFGSTAVATYGCPRLKLGKRPKETTVRRESCWAVVQMSQTSATGVLVHFILPGF